jgi:site-specific DNA-methyltransferase (adenine-specific)
MIRPNNIYNMDCLEGMRQMEAESVDLTVTSPPYDNLRTYNGYCFDFENIARELYRVTKQGGVVVWVVGDATIDGSETGTSFRQALFFMECGFRLHDTMIYRKVNPIPQNHNRYEQCYEYMFCLSKGKPKTFNPIMVKSVHGGEDMNWGGRKTLMDDAQCRRHRGDEVRTVKETKQHDNIFDYTIGGEQTGHPAVFPKLLARDQIISWSNEGDIVFDPFMGSGTTAYVARALGRHYLGFEISDKYMEIINSRMERTKTLFDL